MRLLEVVGLTRRFGAVAALDAVSFTVEEGEIVGLVGPTGSGKTTCFACVSGVVIPDGGRVIFDGRDVTADAPRRVARAGLGHTAPVPRALGWLTALDAVAAARGAERPAGLAARLTGWPRPIGRQTAHALLARVGLAGLAGTRAGALAPGMRRRLELARALASAPRLLLLDGPLAGLSPAEARGLCEALTGLRKEGLTVVLAERQLQAASGLVDRVVELDRGAVVRSRGAGGTRAQSKA
jgi:branched-chain amino acid transport system ATP-binding protein